MPRSAYKQYEKNIMDAIDRFVDSYDKNLVKEHNAAMKKLKREAEKMYDSFLDQFYSYRTKSYIRHSQTRPGTGTGINLYRGQHIRIEKEKHNGFTLDNLVIEFNGLDMESKKYRYNTADEVLDYVMNGIRFTHEFESSDWTMTWEGNYDGEYYSSLNQNMKQSFDDFINSTSNMVFDLIEDKVKDKENEMMKNLNKTIRRNVNKIMSLT